MFEGSPIPLRKWFIATYMFSSHKKGVSSHQLARDLGVTQKTAWFMLHRLRETFTDVTPKVLKDVVSLDETFVGGKNKNRHADKKKEGTQGGGGNDKTIVFGGMQIGGIVVTKIIPDRGIVWKDDKQIVKMEIEKLYDKKNPRVEIEIL